MVNNLLKSLILPFSNILSFFPSLCLNVHLLLKHVLLGEFDITQKRSVTRMVREGSLNRSWKKTHCILFYLVIFQMS